MPGEVLAFGYRKAIAPMLIVLVGLAVGEACLVHLLVALLWSGTIALVLSAMTGATIVWLIIAIRSFDRLPVLVEADRVVLRVGHH